MSDNYEKRLLDEALQTTASGGTKMSDAEPKPTEPTAFKLTPEELERLAEFAGLTVGKDVWQADVESYFDGGSAYCAKSYWNPLENEAHSWRLLEAIWDAKGHGTLYTLIYGMYRADVPHPPPKETLCKLAKEALEITWNRSNK
jgi:hypothetical protein